MKKIIFLILIVFLLSNITAYPVSRSESFWDKSGSNLFYNDGNIGIGTTTPSEKLDVAGNVYILNNLSVDDLIVRSGSSITLAGAKFENEGHYTSVNTNWIVEENAQETGFIGVYANNGSNHTHANLVLEALGSDFNIIKNSQLHPTSPNETKIINEGNLGFFIKDGEEMTWSHYSTLDKDEYGNIENVTGIENHMVLNNTALTLEGVGLIVNGNATANYFIGDGSQLIGINLDKIISPDTLKDLTITNDTLIYNDGTTDRAVFNLVVSKIISPNGLNIIKAHDSYTQILFNNYIRLNINAGTSYLRSNDGKNRVEIKGASVSLKYNSQNRVWIDNVYTEVMNPGRTGGIDIRNSAIKITLNDINRFKADGSETKILSMDGTFYARVSDTQFNIWDGSRNRIDVNSVSNIGISPDGSKRIKINNTGAYYNDVEIGTGGGNGDSDKITSPNELKNLTLTNNDLVYYDGTRDRIDVTAVHSKFFSPDGDYTLLDDSQYLYNDGTRNRLEINVNGGMLASQNGAHSLIVDNTGVFADGSEIVTASDVNIANWDTAYGWGDHDGLYSLLNHKGDTLISPNNNKTLNLTNDWLIYNDGIMNRFLMSDTMSYFVSPNGMNYLITNNTGAYANGEVILTSSDLLVDKIVSPDTLSNLTIDNTSLIYTNSNGEKRFEIDGTQTRIRGVGATPIYIKFGSSSFEINDGVDRFMSNSDKTIMASANDVWWSATYDDKYEVMDDIRARIQASANDTRLISPDGSDILSVADNEFTYNDGVTDRIFVNSVTSRLVAQNGAYISAGTNSYINDGTRARLQIDNSDTILFSPSGTKFLTLDNDGTYFSGNAVFNDAVGIGNDGLTITSSDLNPSFNIIGNGDIFKMKQAQGTNGFFISFYDNNNIRMSYLGHGSSSSQEDFSIGNEEVGGDIIFRTDNAGIVVIETDLKVTDLAGTGNDYVCVNSVGQMFRSSAGC